MLVFAYKKEVIITPEPPLLIGPENNNSCTTSTVISESQSQVTFNWLSALDADEYELVVRDIENGTDYKKQIFRILTSMILERGKTYSWWVFSKNNSFETQAKSSIWTFYLEDSQKISNFPAPANLITPKANQQISLTNGKYLFRWDAIDLDNDIIEYKIYLGSDSNNLKLYSENFNVNFLEIDLNPNQYYYWKVLTIDSEGNTSTSAIQMFKTGV